MAPSRPYWKGYLKLSLVSCPIALYTATASSERVTFRQINKRTGNRLRQQLVDEETGETVEAADKGRGYEVDKGVYLRVEDEELDAIAIESSHTIDIDHFVPKSQIDERYVDSPYYLVPENKVANEAFAVIRDAMRAKGMVGLGRVVLSKRERVVMLQPWGRGLLGATLRYPYELRDAEAYFDDIPEVQIPKDMLALAEHILDSKAADFDASEFHDRYEAAIVAMLNEKKAGLPVSVQRQIPRIVAGTDLMAALRQSIEAEGKRPRCRPRPSLRHRRAKRPPTATPTSARCCFQFPAALPRLPKERRQRRRARAKRRGNFAVQCEATPTDGLGGRGAVRRFPMRSPCPALPLVEYEDGRRLCFCGPSSVGVNLDSEVLDDAEVAFAGKTVKPLFNVGRVEPSDELVLGDVLAGSDIAPDGADGRPIQGRDGLAGPKENARRWSGRARHDGT